MYVIIISNNFIGVSHALLGMVSSSGDNTPAGVKPFKGATCGTLFDELWVCYCTYRFMKIYIYIYMCVCVCVCLTAAAVRCLV